MIFALSSLALLSWLLLVWQWAATWRFPLHQRTANPSFQPPVSLLKPLKGADEHTLQCLRSWFEQDYPGEVQILFGVASDTDPVCEVVRNLGTQYSRIKWELIICGPPVGANAKVSSLIKLSRLARHEVLVVSDADVRVPRDFLASVVAPLKDAEVGLVNCFYRMANPSNAAMQWEAVAVNADFWSQVLQGLSLAPQDFALGAVMATRRDQLQKIGGYEALSDHLADDFQLGNRIVHVAKKNIVLCPVVVDCLSHTMGVQEVWTHQLRWARTIRVCRPAPYALSILSNATIWPLLWAALLPSVWSLGFLGWCLLWRMFTSQVLQDRLGRTPGQSRWFWLAPVKDILQVAIWACAFFGNRIVWRGEKYLLKSDGILVKHGATEKIQQV